MNKLRNANHPVVVEILSAAKVLGCEILKVDLRRDWFHIRNGKEVRIGTFWKGIPNRDLYERVITASIKGRRIDDHPECLYAPYLARVSA
jgi:pyridoxine 5'-phosphate synthase PdxJ